MQEVDIKKITVEDQTRQKVISTNKPGIAVCICHPD
jgi:hypothetical protein